MVGELPELGELRVGLLHLFMLHTSASLTLNENASPDVRRDFESYFNEAVPEDAPYWTHTDEGPDDMPAHIKASVLGPSLSLPIADGRLALGTWQGIYLCEHRDRPSGRRVLATVWGERLASGHCRTPRPGLGSGGMPGGRAVSPLETGRDEPACDEPTAAPRPIPTQRSCRSPAA